MRYIISAAAVAAAAFVAVPAEAALIRFTGSGTTIGTFTSGSDFPVQRPAEFGFDITLDTTTGSCGIVLRPCSGSLNGGVLTISQPFNSVGPTFTLVFTPTTTGNPYTDIGLSFTGTFDLVNREGGATGISQSGRGSFTATSSSGSGLPRANVFLSAVPEPATWAMMIAGFGLTGGAMRRSRRVLAVG